MDKSIRVLVVAPLGVGGVTNMMINIQQRLDRRKLNFDYLVFHDRIEPSENKVVELGSKKFVASVDNIKIKALRRFVRLFVIAKVCRKNKVKILHYNADTPADIMNVIAAKAGGVKVVTLHSHNAGFGTAGLGIRLLSIIFKPLIPLFCDKLVACSNMAARFMFPRRIINKNKYLVLPNGIDLDKFNFNQEERIKIRESLGIEGKYVVGHVGRFTDQKNHTFLLDVFQKILELDNSAILLLFGVGELFAAVQKKAQELGIIDSVIFYGTSNEMAKMWQAIDVFVMPSLHEGLPVTGIEAQASGVPCIFADTITREVDVTGQSEFLSLKDSPLVWAEHILAHKKQKRVSGVPSLRAAHYDIQQTVYEFYHIYVTD